jgi:hypothetical protein
VGAALAATWRAVFAAKAAPTSPILLSKLNFVPYRVFRGKNQILLISNAYVNIAVFWALAFGSSRLPT